MKRRMKFGLGCCGALALLVGVLLLSLWIGPGEPPELPMGDEIGECVDLYGDPLPPHAAARMGTVRLRTGVSADGLGFLPDGQSLVTGLYENRIAVFDLDSGRRVRAYRGHRYLLSAPNNDFDVRHLFGMKEPWERDYLGTLMLEPSGDSVVSFGKTVRRTNLDDGSAAVIGERTPDGLSRGALGPNGQLYYILNDGSLTARGLDTGGDRVILDGKQLKCFEVKCLDDGRLVILTTSPLDPNGRALQVLEPDQPTERSLIVTESANWPAFEVVGQNRVWLAGPIGQISGWEIGRKEPLFVREGKQGDYVKHLQVSPDGSVLAVLWGGQSTSRLDFLDPTSGAVQRSLGDEVSSAWSIQFAPDGKRLVVRTTGGALFLVDTQAARVITPDRGHLTGGLTIAISPDGKRVASAGWKGPVRMWNRTDGKLLWKAEATRRVVGLAFSADGRFLRGTDTKRLFRWDTATGERVFERPVTPPEGLDVHSVFLGPRGEHVLAYFQPPWRNNTLPPAGTAELRIEDFESGDRSAHMMALNPGLPPWLSGEFMLVRAPGIGVLPIDRVDGARAQSAVQLDRKGTSLGPSVVTPDGREVVSVGLRKSESLICMVHDATTGELVRSWTVMPRLPPHSQGAVLAVAPDGKYVAVGGIGHEIRIFERASGELGATFEGHLGAIEALTFTPDSRFLVSASADTTLLVWDLTEVTGD